VHPAEDPSYAGKHDVSFYCDDIQGTVADLKSRGVEFTKDVEDHGYGLVTYFIAPGGVTVQLYQPRYVKASSGKAAKRQKSRRTAKPKNKATRRTAKKAVGKRRR
jgi:hypothetical protein